MKIVIGANEAGQRLDKFCRKWLKDVPLSAIYKAIRKGEIKVNGKKSKEKNFLEEGDIVESFNVKSKGEKRSLLE
ncbi:RluA family pseudouridine synthase [Clostridium sporogenes]|nr:RluA family pseudouridine synthase [Clostridium sporogenes]